MTNEFEDDLRMKFDNLTLQEFTVLIQRVINTYKRVAGIDPYAETCKIIAYTCWNRKDITFNQWKSLNLFVHQNRIKSERKYFGQKKSIEN